MESGIRIQIRVFKDAFRAYHQREAENAWKNPAAESGDKWRLAISENLKDIIISWRFFFLTVFL